VPILNNFNSFKSSKKCLVAMMEYTSLEKATGNFSDTNVLGVGGFGCVYKANFDGGFVAAVKRLGGEDQEYEKEFEVMIVCDIGSSPIPVLCQYVVLLAEYALVVFEFGRMS
jgi:hypothetical protein